MSTAARALRPREADIQRLILSYLLARGLFAWRVNQAGVMMRTGAFRPGPTRLGAPLGRVGLRLLCPRCPRSLEEAVRFRCPRCGWPKWLFSKLCDDCQQTEDAMLLIQLGRELERLSRPAGAQPEREPSRDQLERMQPRREAQRTLRLRRVRDALL